MADIEMDAETLMTVREEVLDCRQCRGLDQIDHDRSGKHRHSSAADAGGGVFHADQQICRSHHPGFQMRQVEHVQSPGWDLSRVVVAGMSHCQTPYLSSTRRVRSHEPREVNAGPGSKPRSAGAGTLRVGWVPSPFREL